MFMCPGSNYEPGWALDPDSHWCRPGGRCPDCGYLSCAEHGCQFNPAHRPAAPVAAPVLRGHFAPLGVAS